MLKNLLKLNTFVFCAAAAVLMFYPLIDESVSIMRFLPASIACSFASVGSAFAKIRLDDMEAAAFRFHQIDHPVAQEAAIEIEQNEENQEQEELLNDAPLPSVGMAYAVRFANFVRGNER